MKLAQTLTYICNVEGFGMMEDPHFELIWDSSICIINFH